MIYYVSTNGNDNASGTRVSPFKTINHAAQIAVAGDTVRVFGGIYRECVSPRNSGEENARITYEAVEGEHPIIKGSEIVTDWEHVDGTVWKKTLPNDMFGDFNPYKIKLDGDWLVSPCLKLHLGDVYINGTSMYEAHSYDALLRADKRTVWEQNGMRYNTEVVLNPENTVYQWYAEVDDNFTTIWGNFQEILPNTVTVEINVRQSCFYPEKSGINYITLRGFEIAHAACPFTPPTADQIGMVGVHWSKGWIIENNCMHDAKCSAISLGKDGTVGGDNLSTRFGRKSGHRYQAESVFIGLRMGWNKETVGSHIIRNNVIYDCGQNGIVGHMGCAFCVIENNEIYNIAMKREFWGHEIAGIKFHAAVDAVIANNNIHHCMLGIWLDWQAQGVRVTKNLLHHNDRDLMLEVTHGPCTVDNNVLLSALTLNNHAQGTAFVHNIFGGTVRLETISERATPYHFPHSTDVAGYAPIYGGDDRLYNNLMLGTDPGRPKFENFCSNYNSYYTPQKYPVRPGIKTSAVGIGEYTKAKQPVWIESNVYSGHAFPYREEQNATIVKDMTAEIEKIGDEWVLTMNIPEEALATVCAPVTTERLGMPRLTEEPYENPDETPIDFTTDILGNIRENVIAGPFASLKTGKQSVTVWKSIPVSSNNQSRNT